MQITVNAIALDPEQLDIHGTEAHLRGSRCTVCSTFYFPRRWECAIDQSACEDVALSDEGVMHVSTWVNKASYGKAELESDGFAVGQIDLPEGPRVQAVLVGDPRQWQPNQRVRLTTESVSLSPDGLDVLAYRYEPVLQDEQEPQLKVGLLASDAAHRWPDRVFTILHGHELTFGELARWVDAIAFDLVSKGVVAGDRVLVHLPNGHEVLVFQLAAWRIGAVAVPVVPIYRSHEIEFIVKTINPRVVVTVPSLAGREPFAEFDEILAKLEMWETLRYLAGGAASGWLPIPEAPGADATPFDLPTAGMPDDCCLILFTSGTTSAPKGAMVTSRSLVQATSAWLRTGIDESDVAFAAAPLAHIAGMIPGCLVPLTAGCRVVIVTRWNGDEAVELIDRHKATFSCGAAVFLQDLVDRYAVAPPELHRLSYFVSGGAATPPDLIRNADALGVHAARAYGMTETAGVITIAAPTEDLDRRAMFDGKLVDGIDVTVVDDTGAELAPGEEGSIRIRGSQVMLGYTDAAVTADQMVDGWFSPGDVGVVTADGWLRVTGRTKDIINRGGEKFSARDIEEAILSHPHISRVAVTSVPHPRFGEAVGVWLVLDSGYEWAGPADVLAHLDRRGLAKAKFPTSWTVVDVLPMTPSGKIQKQFLAITDETEHI